MANEDPHVWLMEQWRQINLLAWRRVLRESIQEKTQRRENYARWILGAVLDDPEYKGTWQEPGKCKFEPDQSKQTVDGEG